MVLREGALRSHPSWHAQVQVSSSSELPTGLLISVSFQARIGDMDGIFVAYHNTARVFGFQYLPL